MLARNRRAQGTVVGRSRQRMLTGPSELNSHPGICRKVPGMHCGTQDQGEMTPGIAVTGRFARRLAVDQGDRMTFLLQAQGTAYPDNAGPEYGDLITCPW